MFQAARKRFGSIATLAVAAALVVAGVATAQGGSGDNGGSAGHPKGPPPMGLPMKGLTYAQLHVLNKEGDAETVRIDQGKVKSVGADSITVTENDGSEVTIPVDEDTKVLGKPGSETDLGDLEAGQAVSVCANEGEAAKAIMVLPKKGEVPAPPLGAPGSKPPRVAG
jgi:hypothetical protein